MNSKHLVLSVITVSAALVLVGCQSGNTNKTASSTPAMTPATATAVSSPAVSVTLNGPIRIDAGSDTGFTNANGTVWLADQGFADGDTIERPDISITNTDNPEIYRSEHYGMTLFSNAVPNGKYIVKLHFCETYDGITGPGDRIFSFNVQGKDFKDFDVWQKAGGPYRAYVETVPVDVTNGAVTITFTPNVENPQINGIEIIPSP